MSQPSMAGPVTVVLTPNGRDIPPSVLDGQVEVTSSPERFVKCLRLLEEAHGIVNLAGGLPGEIAPEKVDFYIPAEELPQWKTVLVENFDGWHFKLEGDFFWLRNKNSLEHSIAIAELLMEWRLSYAHLETKYAEADVNAEPHRKRLVILKEKVSVKLRPIGRKIYPHLPPALKKLALSGWGLLQRKVS